MSAFLLVLACAQQRAAPPVAGTAPTEIKTTKGHYTLRWHPEPNPVVMGELFSVSTTLLDGEGKPVEQGSVSVDARMPQHGHGMTTRPVADPGRCEGTVCSHPEGIYRMDGLKFHMQGEWTVVFTVEGPAGPDQAEARYQL